jgi:hypothetical protein
MSRCGEDPRFQVIEELIQQIPELAKEPAARHIALLSIKG